MYKIVLPKDFLWSKQPPVWAPAFLGSQEHIEEGVFVENNLKSFAKNELELIAVISGFKFFDLLAKTDFKRITLYDLNINEISNFIYASDYLQKTSYQDFDGFLGLNQKINDDPASYYMPQCVQGLVQVETEMGCQMVSNENFRWMPTEEDFNKVKKVLREDLNFNLYLGFPDIDIEGRKAVVFMPKYVQKSIKLNNCALLIPVYTRKSAYPNLSTGELREIQISKDKKKVKK